jgi:hypothetical protein
MHARRANSLIPRKLLYLVFDDVDFEGDDHVEYLQRFDNEGQSRQVLCTAISELNQICGMLAIAGTWRG